MRNYKLCCFKPLDYGAVCYTAIANWYKMEAGLKFKCCRFCSLDSFLYSVWMSCPSKYPQLVGLGEKSVSSQGIRIKYLVSWLWAIVYLGRRVERLRWPGFWIQLSHQICKTLNKPLISLIFNDFIYMVKKSECLCSKNYLPTATMLSNVIHAKDTNLIKFLFSRAHSLMEI